METAVYSTLQIRQIEQRAFASGVASDGLMIRAGTAVFTILQQHWPEAKRVVVLCGSGNNGGDGYVVARLAKEAGYQVEVLYTAPPKTHDSQKMAKMAQDAGVSCKPWDSQLPPADVVVDALLGIGLGANLTGMLADIVQTVNHCHVPVLSIDVPTGVDADTGAIMGMAIQATITVTFIGYKLGLLTGDGASQVGKLVLKHLRLTPHFYPEQGLANYLAQESLSFRPRPRNSHKGKFGHVLIIGGDEGMGGAIMMTAEAALRVGAGRVSVATHPLHVSALLSRCPEVMVRGIQHAADVQPLVDNADVIVIGPGLGRQAWGQRLWTQIQDCPKQMVMDADALYWLAQDGSKKENRILTPHPGEAATLLETTIGQIQRNRLEAAQQLVSRYGGISILKGAGSLIASHYGLALCPYGNPGMATAGMGDVLAGVMAGLVAQFGATLKTVNQAVLVHALAGDRAAMAGGERGLMATDLFPYLRELVNL